MLPPFYYKNVGAEGLFRAFSEVIEQVADDALNEEAASIVRNNKRYGFHVSRIE